MIQIGIDYYPEHWNRALWEEDAARMERLGVHVVRLAEFAWSRMEPEEGRFDFAWLDDAIDVLSRHGMRVILGTPTNCPPLWLYQRHPDTIRSGQDGNPIAIGIRGHRCMMSPTFRRYAGRIVEEMAVRYAGRPEVTAWQLDNELESNHCTCPVCTAGFRDFVKHKYGTLSALNQAWGTAVWSGEFSDWEQIRPPLGTEYKNDWYNPAYLLDYERYAASCTTDYVRFQRDIIRKYNPQAVITTNTCFPAFQPDFHQEFAELDVASYDNYPPSEIPNDPEALYSNAFALDFIRGFKRKNFWIMEQLGGEIGCWQPINRALEPGMLEGYALQAVAHGADLLSFFRWRTACTGAEMFCHGILNHDNQENRRLRELEALCRRLQALPGLDKTAPKSQVAMLYSADQDYALRNQQQSNGFGYWKQMQLLHGGANGLGVNVDVIHEDESLAGYRVVLLPCHFLTNPALVKRLEAFVHTGGTLVVTNRSGVKDQNGNCIFGQPLPTLLRPLCGCSVAEYDAIGAAKQHVRTLDGKQYSISDWCDLLSTDTAEPWAVYADRFYAGTPAITKNRFGAGTVYYVGTVGEKGLYRDLLLEAFREQKISVLPGLPMGMEVTSRSGKGGVYRFFFNNTLQCQRLRFNGKTLDFRPLEVKIQFGEEWA